MTLDELQANYRRERQGLEEQSDDLRRAQSHGEQMVMEAEHRLRSAFNSMALDGEPFNQAKRDYSTIIEQFQETIQLEQRKINHKIEDLEQTYRSEYQKRSNEKR